MSRLSGVSRAIIALALLVISVWGAYTLLGQRNQARLLEAEVPLTQPQLPQPLAAFSENGVVVKITLEQDASGHILLVGTLTPEREHFHLYSKDLPREGIRGQGRPTLLEIVAPSQVKPIGALQADQPTEDHYSRAAEQSLPVYPAGPVIVRLPIELPSSPAPLPAELSVTYMACSEDTCLTPVVDKHVTVVIPNGTGR